MRAVVFCDDRYQFSATVRAGPESLAITTGITFNWVENATAWDLESLRDCPAAIPSKSHTIAPNDLCSWLTDETVLGDHVNEVGRLHTVYSETAGYAEVEPMRAMAGGTFLHHPQKCAVIVESASNHTFMAGATTPFPDRERILPMTLDDSKADVSLHSWPQYGTQPAGWTHIQRKGLVCVLTPRHAVDEWLHPSFQIRTHCGGSRRRDDR